MHIQDNMVVNNFLIHIVNLKIITVTGHITNSLEKVDFKEILVIIYKVII